MKEAKLNISIIGKLSGKNHSISGQAGTYPGNIALLSKIYLIISCSLKNWVLGIGHHLFMLAVERRTLFCKLF